MFRKMAIEIDENVLLTIAGVIFVPIFVFLIKMIMEVGNIRGKLDTVQVHVDETKGTLKKMTDIEYEIRQVKSALVDIDGDLKYLFNSVHHDIESQEKGDIFGSRRRFRNEGSSAK